MSMAGFKHFSATVRNSVGGLQLSYDEAFPNANAIYNFFGMLGAGIGNNWDDMSIAAMLGNMYLESRINPEAGAGYTPPLWNEELQGGLVQWNPSRKMLSWCGANGFNGYSIQGQCNRIRYELQNPLEQWLRHPDASYTFEEFAFGDYTPKTVDRAAEIFALCYERNAGADLNLRQMYSRYWFGRISDFYPLIWPPIWLYKAAIKRERYASYE